MSGEEEKRRLLLEAGRRKYEELKKQREQGTANQKIKKEPVVSKPEEPQKILKEIPSNPSLQPHPSKIPNGIHPPEKSEIKEKLEQTKNPQDTGQLKQQLQEAQEKISSVLKELDSEKKKSQLLEQKLEFVRQKELLEEESEQELQTEELLSLSNKVIQLEKQCTHYITTIQQLMNEKSEISNQMQQRLSLLLAERTELEAQLEQRNSQEISFHYPGEASYSHSNRQVEPLKNDTEILHRKIKDQEILVQKTSEQKSLLLMQLQNEVERNGHLTSEINRLMQENSLLLLNSLHTEHNGILGDNPSLDLREKVTKESRADLVNEAMSVVDQEDKGKENSICVVKGTTPIVVINSSGWISYVPIVNRFFRKTLPQKLEIIV